MESVVSVVTGTSGTKVVYDHWEDGYEIDLHGPSQSTTQIWGDGNDANGIAPGFGSDPNGLAAGAVIALRNQVSLPRNPSLVLYDGRDRIGATKGIVMSRSAWATTPGTVLADATEVSATIDWGKAFVMPVGESEIFPTPATKSMFEMVSLFVQAAQNGTDIQIDADANGVVETTLSLNQGEIHYLSRGLLKGATVTSSKPVQVHLLTGDIGANYESRWFSIPPTDQWGASYYSPVGTASDGDDAYVFLYNPDAAAITVKYETRI